MGVDGNAIRRRSVLVIDDHPLFRAGVRHLLSAQPDFEVCGEAGTAAEAHLATGEMRPDLAILDLDLPDGDAFALLASLRSLPAPPAVLAVEGDGHAGDAAERALRLGASACLSKRADATELLRVAREVLTGQVVLGNDLIARLIHQRPARRGRHRAAAPRDRDVRGSGT